MTDFKKFNVDKGFPLIIISPLDWGLGHTTRCIPIIRELLNLSCNVVVACNEKQKKILKNEFPTVVFKYLQGYEIRYSTSRWRTILSLIRQLPKIRKAIKEEHLWLEKFIAENNVTAIISDNRYGFYSEKIHSVIITHQLNLQTGLGKKINKLASGRIQNYLQKFDQCWIPDNEAPYDIAGILSDSSLLAKHKKPFIQYLGPISRLTSGLGSISRSPGFGSISKSSGPGVTSQPSGPVVASQPSGPGVTSQPSGMISAPGPESANPGSVKEGELPLVILSGPEPQRSILEKKIIRQAAYYKQSCILIRGLPNSTKDISSQFVQAINYADTNGLSRYSRQSSIVICRAGYSSVMDMGKLKKKMILIPTPGQGEQEYLGTYLMSKNIALSYSQENFDLAVALKEAADFHFQSISFDHHDLTGTIRGFLQSIK